MDLKALLDYRKKEADYKARLQELESVTARRDSQRQRYDELRKRRLDEFMNGFGIITLKLKEMYQMITLGSQASFINEFYI